MEILTASAGSYPRIGEGVERQRHRMAYAQWEAGEISDAEFERVQDEVTAEVIREQELAGLDLITDGQVRWYDPVSHFARRVDGCEIDGLLRFFDTNFYFRQPVIRGRLVRREPILRREFTFARRVAKRPVKPVVTGPCTLARLSINRGGGSFRSIVDGFTEVIASEIRDLSEAGAGMIQVDEPEILRHPEDLELLRGVFDRLAAEKGNSELALYTYFGDAAPLCGRMLDLPVEVLGFDLTYGRKLPEVIAALGFQKDIGLGIIDGRNTRIEGEEVLEKLRLMLPRLRCDRVYINPSCGLGEYLPREVAFEKLKNMVAIAERARGMMAR